MISDSETSEKRHYLLEVRTEDSSVLTSSRRAIRVLHFRLKECKDMFDDRDKYYNKHTFNVFISGSCRFIIHINIYLKWIN